MNSANLYKKNRVVQYIALTNCFLMKKHLTIGDEPDTNTSFILDGQSFC